MDLRLMAAATGPLEGVNVSALCREHGISTKTFYKWRARYQQEGLVGLEPRSRRPHRSPGRISSEAEEAIVSLRKELFDAGLDAGAATIRWHVARRRLAYPPPSEATIWRVLVRRGFVVPHPEKRPKSSLRRFQATFPNECWQIDHIEWALADLTIVWIINVLDDHSRLAVASRAVPSASSEAAWATFSDGCRRWGVPWRCLSDNGLCFSGKLRNKVVFFETKLHAAGVKAVTSRPYHPQTCGKVERFQQTLKRWLGAHGPFETLHDLQAALDRFTSYYNDQRPHRGNGRRTPLEAWEATPRVSSPTGPLPMPARRFPTEVSPDGVVGAGHYMIGVGKEHAGRPAEILVEEGYANVFIDGLLVRHLALDTTRRYQGTGKPRGGDMRRRRLT